MYLLFDIGGTRMRFVVSSDKETLGPVHVVPTPQDFRSALDEIRKVKGRLCGDAILQGVAGCTPGPFNKEKTVIINAPNLPGWNGKPFHQELVNIFDCPVLLENDAALAGLGEVLYGAGKGKDIIAYFTVSTGIGGARIVKNGIDYNIWGMEPGQQILRIGDEESTLEKLVSGTALAKRYGADAEDITDQEAWSETARILAIGLHNSIVHWSPEMIILGGSVMKSLPIESVREELQKVMRIFPSIPEVVLAEHGDTSALYGALALLNNKFSA